MDLPFDLASIGPRALISGALATLMAGAVIGLIWGVDLGGVAP